MKKLIIDFIKAITIAGGFFCAILGMKGEMWALAVMFLCFFAYTAAINCEDEQNKGPKSETD